VVVFIEQDATAGRRAPQHIQHQRGVLPIAQPAIRKWVRGCTDIRIPLTDSDACNQGLTRCAKQRCIIVALRRERAPWTDIQLTHRRLIEDRLQRRHALDLLCAGDNGHAHLQFIEQRIGYAE
jgi:hypothetical protein